MANAVLKGQPLNVKGLIAQWEQRRNANASACAGPTSSGGRRGRSDSIAAAYAADEAPSCRAPRGSQSTLRPADVY